jgi:hypothetical protein
MIHAALRILASCFLAVALAACSAGGSPGTAADASAEPAAVAAPDAAVAEPAEMPAGETDSVADTDTATDTTDGTAVEGAVDATSGARVEMPPAPPRSIAVGEPHPGAPGVVDKSCRTDADCAIKDVGSCCGQRPACVNASSPTFPEQVKAACAESGRMGICGFPAITGCKCNAGQCEGTGSELEVQ